MMESMRNEPVKKGRVFLTRSLIYLVLCTYLIVVVYPMLWLLYTSLKTDQQAISADITLLPPGAPGSWQWGNYVTAWEDARLGEFYLNSVIVAVVTTALSVIHNALAGFAFAKLRFAGRRITFALTIATMLLSVLGLYYGLNFLRIGWLERHLHAVAGFTIAICGALILLGF